MGVLRAALLALAAAAEPSALRGNATNLNGGLLEGVRVCGNYCGAGWCGGQFRSESQCAFSIAPQSSFQGGPSCADACCQGHDACCGAPGGKELCNGALVECLGRCVPWDLSCTNGPVPVPPAGIERAMDVVRDWCCGERCPPATTIYE
mmetsp:Transcript_25061/g.58312  ORF Transcript_25061/g.58312 Transcript_25061/m.58312 type:complete len:149 (-) Transcript_25061:70-516(-)|eukprot:CAMPEP_0171098038 /NCGR_PEP_ID=MMETSP0766_2-20121228/47895_1 /TAXON_ID=439317 /ORGANISM="Gambierdiscus australes, Strain CAWD 149" /LENGTH=148 /DNA_ID=CAMNT_0011557327 /DNA_START=43 /DNA_END=489 /DNA_ORIENTATION=-